MANSNRIVLITYYWPPSGGSGVQRWLKFVKYLSKQGHNVHVITPENPAFFVQDETLSREIPKDVVVHKLPIWEPTMLFGGKGKNKLSSNKLGSSDKSLFVKVVSWIRGNLLIPDGRVFWVKRVRKYLKHLLDTEDVNAIITTGPPHSIHMIPLNIDRDKNVKWIADFRDTWSQIDFLQEFGTTQWAMMRHRVLEKRVMQNADIVTTVNQKTAELLEEVSGRAIELLYNGYDPEDFKSKSSNKNTNKFIISHFGLLNNLRYPENLFGVLEELCRENADFQRDLQIELGGIIEDHIIERLVDSPELGKCFINCGYLSHEEVIDRYLNSSLLLLLLNNSELGKTIMTGKVYEYVASGTPILGIGYTESEPAKLISETHTGHFFSYEEKDSLKDYLRDLYADRIEWQPKIKNIEKFSRSQNVKKLVELIGASK